MRDDLHATQNDLPVTPIQPTRHGDLRGPLFDLDLNPEVASIAMASGEDVHELYSAALTKLTANVRPLIMSLTELANEYKRPHAKVVARLIEERIRTVSRDCPANPPMIYHALIASPMSC